MDSALLQQNIWVLVCDGRKSLLLQNEGDHVHPKLVTREVLEHSDRLTHDLGTAEPGRTFSGKGGRRSSIEPVDLQKVAEEEFAKKVASNVSHRVAAHEIAKLIVVAPPSMLSLLRKVMSPHAHSVIVKEIHKDLVRLPLYEIEQHLLRPSGRGAGVAGREY